MPSSAVPILFSVIISFIAGLVLGFQRHKEIDGMITPKVFAKAVYSCASLGGLATVSAERVTPYLADVKAICLTGPIVSFRMRYDGTDGKETKQ